MRFAVCIMVCVALAGCGRPVGVLAPVASSSPGAGRVDLLAVTTRAPAKDSGVLFDGERKNEVSLTDIAISIPPDGRRQVGEVQWPGSVPPNPDSDFATLQVSALVGPHQPQSWLRQHLPRSRRVLVFVHGFNNRYEDAVFQLAQFTHDSGVDAAPVLFTWPSRGSLFQYIYDRESTITSRDALEQTLRELAKDKQVGEITVMAHSMGAWLLMESLRQMSIRDGRVTAKIANVILASPDIDVDVFKSQWREIAPPRPRLTIFVSTNDRALHVSQRLAGDVARLGQIDPNAEPYASELAKSGIDVIDLSDLAVGNSLNHDKFASNPEIVQLIGKRLSTGQSLAAPDSLSERVGGIAMGVGQTVGGVAGVAISAPLAIADPNSRQTYDSQFKNLGHVVGDTLGAATNR